MVFRVNGNAHANPMAEHQDARQEAEQYFQHSVAILLRFGYTPSDLTRLLSRTLWGEGVHHASTKPNSTSR